MRGHVIGALVIGATGWWLIGRIAVSAAHTTAYDAGVRTGVALPTAKPLEQADWIYTALRRDGRGWLFLRHGGPGTPVFEPDPEHPADEAATEDAQFVPPDRLYYLGTSTPGRRSLCMAQRDGDAWVRQAPPTLAGSGQEPIRWFTVLAPAQPGDHWRMWYVEGASRTTVRYAEAADGLTWSVASEPAYAPTDAAPRSVTVARYAGALQAWIVETPTGQPAHLVTARVSDSTGAIDDFPDVVAWQAPELRFGNLAPDALPLENARVEALGDDPQHVRLTLTYRAADGKLCVTTAENFPVVGRRQPTIFARHAPPLLRAEADNLPSPTLAVLQGLRWLFPILAVCVGWWLQRGRRTAPATDDTTTLEE